MSDTRISVKRQTARWDPDAEVSAREAMDFWSFAAAAANVVMQLALPGVGYGVVESKVESGSILKHPWKRLRTTSQYLAVAVFGSEEDRAAFRAAVDGAHRQVMSTAESPVKYHAFDRELQMWVAACLFVGLEDTYKLLRGEMTPEQSEQFYRSSWPLGTPAGHRGSMARDQSRVRHLLGCRLQARGHRCSGPRVSVRSDRSADDQSRSRAALSAAAQISHHRLPCPGVQGRTWCAVE
jgi:uncharacterized protein (DUF2236 family)